MYRDFLKGDAYSTLLKPGYPNNPLADHTPWNQREHPIVFVKTGIDSEAMRKSWIYFPKQVRSLIEDCAALVLTGVDRTIAALCSQVFAERQLHWGEQRELLLSTCSIVDRYVRAVWAERMVRALMRHDALVAGNWSHLDQSGSRARFWGPIPAGQLDALYAETKVLVNTTAGVRYGIQERIIAGMFAKAAVLSDTTPYLQDLLSDCRSFFGVTINETTFDEELDCTLNSILADPETAARVEATAAVAEKLFSFETFIQNLLEFVELEKYRCSVAAWGFPALSPRPIQ
jgi:glycosyltransferase involved in cell wall biosynthesis